MYTLTVHIAPKDTTYIDQASGLATKSAQRRVIEYLLSPIQRAGRESFRER